MATAMIEEINNTINTITIDTAPTGRTRPPEYNEAGFYDNYALVSLSELKRCIPHGTHFMVNGRYVPREKFEQEYQNNSAMVFANGRWFSRPKMLVDMGF